MSSLIRGTLSVAAVGFLVGCRTPNEFKPPPPPNVTVAKPLVQTVTNYLEETGTTEAVERVEIRARVRGFLDEVKFQAGDEVKKGDVLYTIEKQIYEANVEKAKADLAVAKAEFDNADANYRRDARLFETKTITREQFDLRAAERKVAAAKGEAALAQLRDAEINLNYTDVTTPISGKVGKTLVKVGNLVDSNEATHLTTVVKYDPIYANFTISETELLALRSKREEEGEDRPTTKEQRENIKLYLQRANDKGYPFEGHFDYADIAVDQSTGTYLVRGIFPNPDQEIIPGLFVRIRVPIDEIEKALLVPRSAVSFDQEGRYLFVVGIDNKVARRNVTLGPELGDLQAILDGLQADDLVIISGIQRAREGAEVAPQQTTLLPYQGEEADAQDGAADQKEPPAEQEATP